MKNLSLRGRLGLIFLGFAFLVLVSVSTTFLGIQAQKEDALVINLAGRQRMLVQQMTRQALEIERQPSREGKMALQESADTFEQTLIALRDGGGAPYLAEISAALPGTKNPQTRHLLDQIAERWEAYRGNLQTIIQADDSSAEFQAAIQSIERIAPELVGQSDSVVRQYAAEATYKTERIRWVQIGFLISALLLLGLGALVTRGSVLEPLQKLNKSAERIGSGDLTTPVQIEEPVEFQVLGSTLDEMRSQLNETQEELRSLADTLEERVVRRTVELDALYAVSRDISSRLDINYVLNSVTEKARQLLDSEIAYLCMLDETGQTLSLQSTSGPETAIQRSSTSASLPLPSQILSGTDALLCGTRGCWGGCEIMTSPYQTSHLAAPLQAGNRIIGALCVGSSEPNYFPTESLGLLTKLANAAAIAIENARLYDQAERSATLEERQRLAAEMHDGLAQTLNYMQMSLELTQELLLQGKTEQALATLDRCHVAIDQASQETRRAIASLQDELPIHASIQDQLVDLVKEFSDRGDSVKWTSEVKAPLILPRKESEQVLRLTREALLNAHNHSQAKHVTVCLARQDGLGVLSVSDDGLGFNPQVQIQDNGQGHFGLSIMRARAAHLNGRLDIESSPASGTLVRLSWPLNFGEDEDLGIG